MIEKPDVLRDEPELSAAGAEADRRDTSIFDPNRRRQRWLTPKALLLVYRARLRARLVIVQELFAILGIAVGVALLFSSQVASTSLNSSVRQLSAQLIGRSQFQIDARSPAGFSERLVGEMQHLPGVRTALPIIDESATLIGPSGQEPVDLIGVSPRFVRAAGPLLRRFSANQLVHQQALALPAPLAAAVGVGPLQAVRLVVSDRVVQTLVATDLQEADIGGLVHDPVAIAPLAYAQSIARMSGRVTRAFVRVDGESNRVRSALQALARREHLDLEPADFDTTLFSVASSPQDQGEELFSAISAIVGFLFAFTAMLLTIPQRRELVEVLRMRGNTRTMTIQTLAFEGMLMGVAACILGLALGELLSAAVFKPTPGYLSFAFPVGAQRIITWQTITLSIVAGMAAALAGVLAPMRDILGPSLGSKETLERDPKRWVWLRTVIGLVCLALTTAILVLRPQSAVLGNITLVAALGCLLPFLFNGSLIIFDRLQGLLVVASPKLAIVHLRDPMTRVRSLAVAATAAVAVFGSVAVQGAQHNLQAGLNRTATELNFVTGLWVSPAGAANTLGTTPFPAIVAHKLERLPGVAKINVYRGGFLDIGDRRTWVIAPPRDSTRLIPSGQLLQGNLGLATRRVREGGWAVLSEAVAKEQHLHIGQSFTLPAPNPTTLRVAALSTNAGWPPGAVILNAEDYARAWGSTDASALNIALAPGRTPEQVRREVVQALGSNTGLAVQTAAERAAHWKIISEQGLSRLSEIATLMIVAALFAIGGVLGSMLWQRREGLADLKRQSYKRGTLWRALFWETVLLLGSGCLIGGVFGLYGQLLISHALATVTGFPIIINIGVFIALSSFAIVCAAALAVLAVPGYLAVRVRPNPASST